MNLSSRGLSPSELSSSVYWWNGPNWLSELESSWKPFSVCLKQDESPEQQKIKLALVASSQYNDLILVKSDWNKLVRATAWLALFVNYMNAKNNIQVTRYLTLAHLKKEETIIVKRVQNECFHKEIIALEYGS